MPPLNSLQIIPVPPPTLPSGTGPPRAESRAAKGVLGLHVEAVHVVQVAVPGLGHHGERPPAEGGRPGAALLELPGDDGVAHHAHAVGVGDHDGGREEARLLEPGGAGHFAVAVEGEPSAEDGVGVGPSPGEDGGHPRPHRALAHHQLALALDDRAVPDLDALDVGDGVLGAGSAVEGYAEVAGPGLALGRPRESGLRRDQQEEARQRRLSHFCSSAVSRSRALASFQNASISPRFDSAGERPFSRSLSST